MFSQIGYARGSLMSSLVSKARQFVTSHYNLPGKLKTSEVKDVVAFLTRDGCFKYGKVDIEASFFTVIFLLMFDDLLGSDV